MPKTILYLGNKLSHKGVNITTIESLSQKLISSGYMVKSYSDKRHKLLRLTSMLAAVIRHKNFDFILIDTYSTSAFWFAYLSSKLAKFFKTEYILILHGGDLENRLENSPKLSKKLFSGALVNIAPSKFLYETFKNQGYQNIKLIPNFIDIKDYPFKKRKKIHPKLLWVRAFADIYNPMMALKVLEILLKSYPNSVLSMVGPEKDHSFEACKAYAKTQNLPVTFTGQLSKTEWLNYSKNFDIFINTTTVDNTPVSVIEAMALGLPVVSTDVGGLPYLIENSQNGLLVKSKDTKAMIDAVSDLIEQPESAHALTLNARKMVEGFDWNVVKKEWESVLK
jgi:glycosyltransferase involved in cell wall biosynthesis